MALPLNPVAARAVRFVADALELNPEDFTAGTPPKPEMGDFAVGCFPAAKQLRKAPPAIAAEVVAKFQPDGVLESATAAGPFVNFRARRADVFGWLFGATEQSAGDSQDAGESVEFGRVELVPKTIGSGKTVCIDYSSPNISKHLHYHHIRSTVIGHALANMFRALGYNVVGINHLGDWGTTHGMLIAAYKLWGIAEPISVSALNDAYVRFRAEMKTDPELEKEGRAWFKKLEDGDSEARALWTRFREVSLAEFQSAYDLLGIRFEEIRGESAYEGDMPGVLEMLDGKGLSSVSQGALVVDLEEHGLPPLLLKKQDGATLYATRDLAAAMYRWNTYHFDKNLYVVDRGQSVHFKQLFYVLAKAGYTWAENCAHVPFGLIRLGGKKTSSRSSGAEQKPILLKDVFAEAAERSQKIVAENNPSMDETTLRDTAQAVGIGAVVFANLASQRDKDVDFVWEAVLSTKGDSGPYVQYAHARCCRLLEKAEVLAGNADADDVDTDGVDTDGVDTDGVDADGGFAPALLTEENEWDIARRLLDFADVVQHATNAYEPHHIARFLLDLCALFSRWYTAGNQDEKKRILCGDRNIRGARLALVRSVRNTLRQGLEILGLAAPSAM